MRNAIGRAAVIMSGALALVAPGTAHADYLTDYPAAVTETVNAGLSASVANAVTAATAPITCQISEKAGGPIVNPGINTGAGVAVFPQDYASAGAQCFSFQQKNYWIALQIILEKRNPNGTWTAYDSTPLLRADAIEGVAVVPQTVLRHVYDRIPDPHIGTTGSVHRGRFKLVISTGQPYADEFTPLPWTMAPW